MDRKGGGQQLDPDIQFFSGPQYISDEKPNFGLFLDSSPDRWGRMLMNRREAVLSRETATRPATLMESDYLLGVDDTTRMGAIRFKLDVDGPFLADNQMLNVPPITRIRELEQASLHVEDDPLLTLEKRNKLPQRGGSGIVQLEAENGIFVINRDLVLGLNIPNYE